MIPALTNISSTHKLYQNFIKDLRSLGFQGELCLDYANRTVLSTDNSIYQVLPQGVIYPKHTQDLVALTQLCHQDIYCDVVVSPRGGGTGTNGQSLTEGLIVDTSRHMNKILEINEKKGWARVQCGVVKDQLNAAVKAHGLFFAPELSTSNRATIGGMINTDASGQGSCAYGKTRDHVLELSTVLMDGTVLHTKPLDSHKLVQEKLRQDLAGDIYRLVDQIDREHYQEIQKLFPPLNRCLTGYDLAHIRTENGNFDLNSLLCGSEGTLGFIAEAKINLLPIPLNSALVNLHYDDFDTALRDATNILKMEPTAIETIDSMVLKLAKEDNIWRSVEEFFPEEEQHPIAGINLVEYTANSQEELIEKLDPLLEQLNEGNNNLSIGYTVAWNDDVKKIWDMRKKAVGLLGNVQGEARPVAFVEDTCVPPEHLADYIVEFRQLLDSYNLEYGMFGHVDAGVLHVRPILDMKHPGDEHMIRTISDKVVKLTQKYKGLLWGEHGKGLRSEYSPQYFGKLYPLLQQIKQAFDPHYQLNPGKIATPMHNIPLLKIDEVPTRGQFDKMIDVGSWQAFKEGMFCNGNGACHNWDPSDAMCPSWKATRKRTHTPKGRASLVREWLFQLRRHDHEAVSLTEKVQQSSWLDSVLYFPSRLVNTIGKKLGKYDFSHEIHESMMGCLSCKSCTGSCPIKVDVPEFRSKFLELYYTRYCRPMKDYFVGSLERFLPIVANVPTIYNLIAGSFIVRRFLTRVIGLSDSPLLSTINFNRQLRKRRIQYATPHKLSKLDNRQKQDAVILVLDAFSRFFETQLVLDTLDLLQELGYTPWIAPYAANGKPLHVHGFRKAFEKVARKNADILNELEKSGITLIGIEPSMTLAYRDEYQKINHLRAPKVELIQEWLGHELLRPHTASGRCFKLLSHCTEKTNAAASEQQWQKIFRKLGHQLDIIDVGCCGMAGTFGHETENVTTSEKIYHLSWHDTVHNPKYEGQLLATGFSCRSQVKRFSDVRLLHPIQALKF